jgi:hypothetical protein
MSTLFTLLLLLSGAGLFWQQRRQAEQAEQHLRRYCRQHELQLLSVARSHRQLARQPLRLLTYYQFEFSSDGESHYEGTLIMQGDRIARVLVPAHRVPLTHEPRH